MTVALIRADSYAEPALSEKIFKTLDAAQIAISPGMAVLVKPNLLMSHALACTTPTVVAAVCEWLLSKGAKVSVADSPAFGTAQSVAAAIGLTEALKRLSLKVQNFSRPVPVTIEPYGHAPVRIGVAKEALEADLVLSVPRVKAHSQMRITLAVKNCYGCICGLRKALYHARFGISVEYFADCVAALWAILPPVAALCDGITAMSVTGPRNGKPFSLGLLGASAYAPALDEAILAVLGIDPVTIPLAAALRRAGVKPGPSDWPLVTPAELAVSGFQVPVKLKNISFNPLQLSRSLLKRLWLDLRN